MQRMPTDLQVSVPDSRSCSGKELQTKNGMETYGDCARTSALTSVADVQYNLNDSVFKHRDRSKVRLHTKVRRVEGSLVTFFYL